MAEDDSNKISIRAIIEIAGFPKEHVDETMKNVVKSLEDTKGLTILKHKTFPVEKIEKMFSTFTEFDLELPNMDAVMAFCFNFMPSSVEFLKGKKNFEPIEVNNIINDTLAQLHKYDMVVKNLRYKVVQLEKQIQN
jgi:hypothetical protein